MAIRCTCGHLWLTTSKSMYPTCPRCHTTVSRKRHAVVLESDTTRKLKLKEKADSELRTQNTANGNDGNYENLQR
jgi:predicted  nucleic acid-binding Zn-ribbon protein